MELIQVFSWTSFSTIINVLAKLIKGKIIAVIIGPAGIAYVGQLNDFISLFSTVGSGGITQGLTKYVAEYKDSKNEYLKYFGNGMLITMIFSIIASAVLIIYSSSFANAIFQTPEYTSIVLIFSVTIFAVSFNRYLLAITNGFKEYRKFISIDIVRNLFLLVFSIALVLLYKVYGILLSIVLSESIVLIITIIMLRKTSWFNIRNFVPAFDKLITRKLLSFSLVTVATFFVGPVSLLLIRTNIIEKIGIDAAGYWDGATRISGYVLLIITQALTVYLVPRFSELTDKKIIRKEIINVYKIIIPLLLIGYSIIYFLKDFIISLLLSDSFIPMGDLLFFQFLGDFIKILSTVISMLLIAKAMIKTLIITQIFMHALYVALAYFFISMLGLKGVVISHTIMYTLSLMIVVILFRDTLFLKAKTE